MSTIAPPEADAPLIIDPDAVLTCSIPAQCLKPVAWWHAQIIEASDRIEKQQFATGRALDRTERFHELIRKQALCVPVGKALDHAN